MLAPALLAGDPLVALEAQLGKAVAGCETGLVTSVNMIPLGSEREAVESKPRSAKSRSPNRNRRN